MKENNIFMTSKEIFELLLRRKDLNHESDKDLFGGLGVEIRKLEDGHIVANLEECRCYIDLKKSYLTNDYKFVVYGIEFLNETYKAYGSKTKEEFESKLKLNERDIFNETYTLDQMDFRIKNILPFFKYKNIIRSLNLKNKLDVSAISHIGNLFTDKLFTPVENEEYCYEFEGFIVKLKRQKDNVTLSVCIGYYTICEITHNINDGYGINMTKNRLYSLRSELCNTFQYYLK